MSLFKMDPGPCGICGAAHTTCTATTGAAPTVSLLPMRDAATAGKVEAVPLVGAIDAPPLVGDVAPATLGDGSDSRPFSTATYRGRKRKKTR